MIGRSRIRDLDSVRNEVRRIVARQRPGGPHDLSAREGDVEALLAALDEHQRIWTQQPVLVRTALVETPTRLVPFVENIVMPPARHDLVLLVKGLNFMRGNRGLPEAKLPFFLQPDELAATLATGAPCLCDAERAFEARRRTLRRLGRRRVRSLEKQMRKVLVRDSWKCTRCDSEHDLHVHRLGGEISGKDLDGYVTLCRAHHLVDTGQTLPRQLLDEEVDPERTIRSQMAIFFQRGRIKWVGFVFGRDYVVLSRRKR